MELQHLLLARYFKDFLYHIAALPTIENHKKQLCCIEILNWNNQEYGAPSLWVWATEHKQAPAGFLIVIVMLVKSQLVLTKYPNSGSKKNAYRDP